MPVHTSPPIVAPDRSVEFWNREHTEPEYRSWLDHPRIREYAHSKVGRGEPMWPVDWFQKWCQGRVFERALSIGCGTGSFEIDIVRRGVCTHLEAFDASQSAIDAAGSAAAEAGLDEKTRFFLADFNTIRLAPGSYDLVISNHALHHVKRLEHLFAQLLRALRPGGLFYIDDYVGPSRTYWTPRRFRFIRSVYNKVPEQYRQQPILLMPIQPDDPSEAIRSGEVSSLLKTGFDLVEQRDYGGNLLSPIYPALEPELPSDLVEMLIREEEERLAKGERSWCTVILARPATGFRRRTATLSYRLRSAVYAILPLQAYCWCRKALRRFYVAIDRRVRRKPIQDYV